jgi:1-deoxy-D-xylulose-5-phosphate reductoisomerase
VSIGQLTFQEPDHARFRCLGLALDCLRMGGLAPTILNAANEVAVEAFLGRRIGFSDIPRVVEATLEAADGANAQPDSLDAVLATDARARESAGALCRRVTA